MTATGSHPDSPLCAFVELKAAHPHQRPSVGQCRPPAPLRSTFGQHWPRRQSCTNNDHGPLSGGRSVMFDIVSVKICFVTLIYINGACNTQTRRPTTSKIKSKLRLDPDVTSLKCSDDVHGPLERTDRPNFCVTARNFSGANLWASTTFQTSGFPGAS